MSDEEPIRINLTVYTLSVIYIHCNSHRKPTGIKIRFHCTKLIEAELINYCKSMYS